METKLYSLILLTYIKQNISWSVQLTLLSCDDNGIELTDEYN